jgi:hypothetical protein
MVIINLELFFHTIIFANEPSVYCMDIALLVRIHGTEMTEISYYYV